MSRIKGENSGILIIKKPHYYELEENECLKFFEPLKVGSELILDEKAEQLQKQKKIEEVKKRLHGIGQKLKDTNLKQN